MQAQWRAAAVAALLAAGAGMLARPAPACLTDFTVDGNSPGAFSLFPNWRCPAGRCPFNRRTTGSLWLPLFRATSVARSVHSTSNA